MDPALRLKLSPERRLVMTFALRQALEVLQMPQIELAQWLSQEIEKNPLLNEISSSKKFSLPEEVPSPVSLYDHLMRQIGEAFLSASQRKIAEELLEHLDEKGYLSTPLNEIACILDESLSQVESVLQTAQSFDPPGIFARNLQEALLLQLKAQGQTNSSAYLLIRDCFDDLIHGRYGAIKKKMKAIDLSQAIQKLARLHFRPSGAFRRDIAPAAIADLRISQTETGWVVQTIEDELPKFEIVQKYDSLALPSLEEKESLRAWSAAGKWLFRSLKRRRQILIEIGAFLIRKQTSFLSSKGNLRPLLLSDLAAHLGLHESTLSRALSGKYAETPRGLLPLRSFFASSPQTNQAKALLQQLIDREDKKNPLTDDQISTELKASGYPVARRTIAKYRRELKIGSASSRKHVHPGIL